METKQFPNGFTSWMETHHEIVEHLVLTIEDEDSLSHRTSETMGTGGLYELGERLTDEFEELYKGKEWDGEYFDAVHEFLRTKENP